MLASPALRRHGGAVLVAVVAHEGEHVPGHRDEQLGDDVLDYGLHLAPPIVGPLLCSLVPPFVKKWVSPLCHV